ncbi:peptidoglycan DD-metalloendopeptidase family protein [Desulfobacterales bacterium HSG2]|nr:peptidoglycan DD-metalloendopeptidase family protein [Desulfobacterales bacterium HSG2]
MVLILFPAGISGAKSDKKIENLKKEAENINRKIKKSKVKVQTFTKKEKAVISSLNKAELALDKARKRVAAARAELVSLEEKVRKTKAAARELMKQIQVSENYASRRMIALYKLNRLGKMHLLASADSVTDFFQRKTALERILAYDQEVLEDLANSKAKLQKLSDTLNAQKKKKLSLEAACKKQVRVVSRKKTKRSKLLADIRKKKSLTLASIDSLKHAAKALNQKVKAMILKFRKSEKTRRKMSPSGKFFALKGLLNMPVQGKVTSFYGRYKNAEFNVMNFRSGIDIKAKQGSPIHAVYAGRVLFSSWFKGYGNMIIIDHGNHYCTLYAHAEEVFKKQGDRVKTGETIATVGDAGSMTGPGLHFEVRHHGKSIDPMKWLRN